VLGCWESVMKHYEGTGRPPHVRIAACVEERTQVHNKPCEWLWKDQPRPADLMEGIPETSTPFIGMNEQVLMHNRKLYKEGHHEVCA
jgi:hypothetical protein